MSIADFLIWPTGERPSSNPPRLNVDLCNINNLLHLGRCLLGIRKYDLIIISHAAAGDDMALSRVGHYLQRRRGKIAMFIGNEYDLLDEKLMFISEVEPEYVCSQLPMSAARYLYQGATRCEIVELPTHSTRPVIELWKELQGTRISASSAIFTGRSLAIANEQTLLSGLSITALLMAFNATSVKLELHEKSGMHFSIHATAS